MSTLRNALDESLTPAAATRRTRWLLAGILATHCILSVWLGWVEPGPSRWWDERFNVFNVEAILSSGQFQLANGYYGGVSYLPQTLVLAAAQKAPGGLGLPPILNPGGYLTAAGYHVLRVSQAIWGTAALLLLFLLARRLMPPNIALLAVAFMAVSSRLHHASAIFKPDVELLATTLLALILGWRAATSAPKTRDYLAAGVAIGLAVGSKLNGVAVAAPLVLATLVHYREWTRWPRLALAGVASFLTFWMFNPDIARVLRSLDKNRAHYEYTATGGVLDVLWETLLYPFRENFHGPWVAGLGLVGVLLVAAWLLGLTLDRDQAQDCGVQDRRLAWWMLLSYPPTYYLLYALASPRAKANHFLQIVPFVALFAAVSVGVVAVMVRGRNRWLRLALAGVLLYLIATPAFRSSRWIYEQTVPTTWDQAQDWIEAQLPPPSRAYRVASVERARRGRLPRSPAYARVPVSASDLSGFDALIVPRTSIPALVTARSASIWLEEDVPKREFQPGAFRARGEALVAALRPGRLVEHPDAGRVRFVQGDRGTLSVGLPASLSDAVLSVRLRIGLGDRWASRLYLLSGKETLHFTLGPASGGDIFVTTPRFRAPGEGQLVLGLEGKELPATAKAELFVWSTL
ncbi:MAG: glycosyltransferase family 39 protein [Thermoanaerobaculia bacterium]|nr:glycosyltransferase family 39 protein [Thermoanaerobaculia bacterium]